MLAPTVWYYMPYTFTPAQTMLGFEFVSLHNKWLCTMSLSTSAAISIQQAEQLESPPPAGGQAPKARRLPRLRNARLPRAVMVPVIRKGFRLRNAKLPRNNFSL